MSQRILFVLSSAEKSLQGDPTGWYLPEAAHPYYVLSPHFAIDFAAPGGPNPPMDPSSQERFGDDEECKRFLNDPDARNLLENAKFMTTVNANDYDAIYYVGGRGPVIDLPEYKTNIQLAYEFYRTHKLVSAVCHGPAALVWVTDEDGKSIFNGKNVTGFSNAEEEEIGNVQAIPFLLEDRIKLLGGTYEKANENFDPKVVCAGNLITGQNPASARPLAEEIKKWLQANKRAKAPANH
ncbi:class I glutamine amidotransferase-like protein [Russula ochroleuca]|uniref:D-lactate dehydratase n=1 Tax=Russula ochroleuca TaxID=152965 RepID=A0A9P5N1P5_9AGAM|nr:class I glutamine amidotransferase-like protein [Russula ochroleuca]